MSSTSSPSRQVERRPRQFSIRLILIATVFVAAALTAVRNLNGETLLVVGMVGIGLAWGNLLVLVGAFVGALLAYATSTGPAIETSHVVITATGLALGGLAGWSRHRRDFLEGLQEGAGD